MNLVREKTMSLPISLHFFMAAADPLVERELEYSEIYPAVYKLTGSFFTLDDVDAFLSRMDVQKSNSSRFICWLISFGLLPPNDAKWATGLYSLYQRYRSILQDRLPDPLHPLSAVRDKTSDVIACDIERGLAWFYGLAGELQLSEFYTRDAELRVTRVLSLLSLSVPEFSYCQGYDRYAFVNYLLALDFCSQCGLPVQFAEALSFPLVNEFIKMTRISHYLENPTETEAHFDDMDRAMADVCPEKMMMLREMQHGSIHFALRWELLLFADEYNARPLLLLWDQVLHVKDRYRDMLFALCIAHLKQVPLAGTDEIMVEKIQQFKGWNLPRIIADAHQYMDAERTARPMCRMFATRRVIWMLLVAIVVLWFLSLNRH